MLESLLTDRNIRWGQVVYGGITWYLTGSLQYLLALLLEGSSGWDERSKGITNVLTGMVWTLITIFWVLICIDKLHNKEFAAGILTAVLLNILCWAIEATGSTAHWDGFGFWITAAIPYPLWWVPFRQ